MTKPVWTSTTNVPTHAGKIIYNSWVKSDAPTQSSSVTKMSVDWLRIEASSTATPTATAKPTVTPTATPTATATPGSGEPAPSSKYAVYDTFSSYNTNVWTKSDYTMDSFIDTKFMPSNIYYQDGKMVMKSYVDQHTGSELKSNAKYSYGKYRASIKLDQTEGSWLTFFSYMWETGANREGHNEMDFEFQKSGSTTTALLSSFHNDQLVQSRYTLPFDPSAAYHVYEYDWYSDRVEFYIDDNPTPIWVAKTVVPSGTTFLYFQNWIQQNPSSNHGDGENTEYVDWVTYEPF
jgi:beta-glucanase (GH16 family)